jgi:glycosyltransferase involved in cell wall biosynthesis
VAGSEIKARTVSRQQLVGIIGSGMIGTDPFALEAWSGSSRRFFSECNRRGLLRRAFGAEVDPIRRSLLILRNYSPDGRLWRQKFHLDTRYYGLLSRTIARMLSVDDLSDCALLQIGGIFDLRKHVVIPRGLYSYHDGNLAQAARSPYFPKNVPRRVLARALEFERGVASKIDRIFTMSAYLKTSFVEDYGVAEDKVQVIGAGINIDAPSRLEAKDYSRRRLLFVGVDFKRKGGWEVLQAFKLLRSVYQDAVLDIVGPRTLTIPNEYCTGVNYHGFLSKDNPAQSSLLAKLLQESTLFVMPSLYEPFGVAPLEAMAYGIPCVVTDAWAFPEMVRPGFNGELVACGNHAELADKMISLMKDPDALERMGLAGRERALSEFTWEVVVARLSRHLADVAG